MYYRRKLILAVLEAWNGRLAGTDFQKILFLLCKRQTKPNFEFVPYKFGCFSWQSYADKRAMTAEGLLAEEDDWRLAGKDEHLETLVAEDRNLLLGLRAELGSIGGNDLIRLVYRKFPYFAIHSEKAATILNKAEMKKVNDGRPSQTSTVLFTIGYEGKSLDGFLGTLIRQNVFLLCDVRKNAFSMKYGFSKQQLNDTLGKLGIRYRHIPELGIESEKRRGLESERDYQILFQEYEKETLPSSKPWIDDVIREVMEVKRVALMCFEKDACMCHRGRLAKAIQKSPGFRHEVIHL